MLRAAWCCRLVRHRTFLTPLPPLPQQTAAEQPAPPYLSAHRRSAAMHAHAFHRSANTLRPTFTPARSCPAPRPGRPYTTAMQASSEKPVQPLNGTHMHEQKEQLVQPDVTSSGHHSTRLDSTFKVGDLVDVRKHGRAVIIEGPHNEPGNALHGRFRVQYDEDGTRYWVTPARLRHRVLVRPSMMLVPWQRLCVSLFTVQSRKPHGLIRTIKQAKSRIVVARYTAEYRQAALHNVGRQDVCLEIGCHEGVTTFILSKRCRGIIGVDLSSHVIHLAKNRYPELHFHQLDGNNVAGAQALLANAGLPPVTKLLIDISGQAPVQDLLPLLDLWLQGAPEALIIVKNRALHCAVSAMEQSQQSSTANAALQQQATQLGSQMSQQVVEEEGTASDDGQDTGVQLQGLGYDEVAELLLGTGSGNDSQEHAALQQLLLKVCQLSEVFQDPSTSHEKTSFRLVPAGQLQQQPGQQPGQQAVQQAAKIAQEVADKADRLRAKRERRAAKKAHVTDPMSASSSQG